MTFVWMTSLDRPTVFMNFAEGNGISFLTSCCFDVDLKVAGVDDLD